MALPATLELLVLWVWDLAVLDFSGAQEDWSEPFFLAGLWLAFLAPPSGWDLPALSLLAGAVALAVREHFPPGIIEAT